MTRVYELEFTAGGEGFLATHDKAPAGFFEELAATFRPDGYLVGAAAGRYAVGAGCGNAMSLLEAFPATPRGLVLADPDLAVVCGLEMLAGGLAQHAGAEGFAAAGEDGLRELEERVLHGRRSRGLAVPGESARQRLWRGLCRMVASLDERSPSEWARLYPAPGEILPVWTYVVRNYARLHELARAGAITVVQASVLDPELPGLLSGLPGFDRSANVFYLANAADHEVRRVLFASARRKLGLTPDGDGPEPSSTPELVAHVNAELEGLSALAAASGRALFVHTSETWDMVLKAGVEPPRHRANEFFLQLDLDRLARGLFEAPAAADGEAGALGEPWRGAPSFQRDAHALFGAAFRRDQQAAGASLERLARQVEALPLAAGGDGGYMAFRLAELAEGVALVRKRGLASAFPGLLGRLTEEIREAAGQLAATAGSEPAGPETFLLAHACSVAGSVLDDPGLAGLGVRLATAGLAQGKPGSLEALFRLLRHHLHAPSAAAAEAVRRGVADLIAGSAGGSEPGLESRSGYESHALAEDVIASDAILLLFFQGLAEESLATVRAALLMRPEAVSAS